MGNTSRLGRSGLPALALSIAWPTLADAADNAPSAPSDDIVVTARKRDETAQSVPVSINAFSHEQLEAAGISEARDIVKITPGLQWKSDSPFNGNNIFLRGVGVVSNQFTSSPAVAVYLDDTYFNSKAYQGFALFDIDRVEVLKGPQGTLYGRNTTGGALKYVTRKPKIGAGLTGDIDVEGGNFGLVKAQGGIGANLGDNAAVRLSFLSWDRGSIYNNYALDSRVADLHAHALRLQFLYKPTTRLTIDVSGSYGSSASGVQPFKRIDYLNAGTFSGHCPRPSIGTAPGCTSLMQAAGAGNDTNTDAFQIQSNFGNSVKERLKVWGLTGNIDYDLGFASLVSASSYYELKLSNPQDVDASSANMVTIDDSIADHQLSQELRLTSNGRGALKWVLGGYFFYDHINQGKPVNLGAFNFGFGNHTLQSTSSGSVFGEATYSVTPKLDLTLGGRWSVDHRDVDWNYFNYTGSINYDLITYDQIVANHLITSSITLNNQTKTWNNVSGRVVASYKFTPAIMSYVSVNRGYKAGEFNAGASTADTAIFVKPEKLDAYEVGIKSWLFDHRLKLNLAGFWYEYTNKQETFFEGGVATLSNANARIKGLEADVTAHPFKPVTINVGYSYLDARYTRFASCLPDGSDCTGLRLPETPTSQLNASVRYDTQIKNHDFSMQVSGEYEAMRYFDYQNVAYISSPSYWLFGARMTYELSPGLKASAWMENIGNRRYYNDGFDVSSLGYSLLVPGTPRTYGVSIGYHF